MADYDLIIAGAGVAGCAAAFTAAKAGLKTLVFERGKTPGAKNVTGGRLYAHSLEKLIPRFAEEAPVERCVTRERVSFLTEKEAFTLDYAFPENPDFALRSYTVLRARFDQWLWSKAEAAGAKLMANTRIDGLIRENDRICGVKTLKGEYRAPITILADGVNSLLAQHAGLAPKPKPGEIALGVKEVIEFSPEQMRERFCCSGDDGLAWLFMGAPTQGKMGGGFLYTNKNSISLGIVFTLGGADKSKPPVPQLLENFKSHPVIAPLLDGGKVIKYPAHMVPEGGINMMPDIYGNGYMIAGDAAAMCVNLGYTVRGMDFAIAAGRYAAEAAVAAHINHNFSSVQLSIYEDLLDQTFVLKEMELYRNTPAALDNERIFSTWPQLACGLMGDLFTINGQPRSLLSKFWGRAADTGAINLVKDGIRLMGAL